MRIRSEVIILRERKAKRKSHVTPASSPGAAAQPGAQGDAGLRFGVFPLVRPPAPLSSGVRLHDAKHPNWRVMRHL